MVHSAIFLCLCLCVHRVFYPRGERVHTFNHPHNEPAFKATLLSLQIQNQTTDAKNVSILSFYISEKFFSEKYIETKEKH